MIFFLKKGNFLDISVLRLPNCHYGDNYFRAVSLPGV